MSIFSHCHCSCDCGLDWLGPDQKPITQEEHDEMVRLLEEMGRAASETIDGYIREALSKPKELHQR